ncbi:hypothetical protein AQI88_23790 [Streptomyces cellostaticus]|uniref:RNA polymerase sigma-70 region 2 domain-containing protein n=1 Tax=Streptomyces cellostaticus TaxID=67285 RepID=A0A117PVC5_9ACTN|nr:hypothetical protein AQI88_23790 [Streptomyces cellostaticus]GHI05064.1 hypothetical protein Scel_33850 [Streptomyces cellostaticus]
MRPQVLGALVRRYGPFDAAEDAVQEALLAAALAVRDAPPDRAPREDDTPSLHFLCFHPDLTAAARPPAHPLPVLQRGLHRDLRHRPPAARPGR